MQKVAQNGTIGHKCLFQNDEMPDDSGIFSVFEDRFCLSEPDKLLSI